MVMPAMRCRCTTFPKQAASAGEVAEAFCVKIIVVDSVEKSDLMKNIMTCRYGNLSHGAMEVRKA